MHIIHYLFPELLIISEATSVWYLSLFMLLSEVLDVLKAEECLPYGVTSVEKRAMMDALIVRKTDVTFFDLYYSLLGLLLSFIVECKFISPG